MRRAAPLALALASAALLPAGAAGRPFDRDYADYARNIIPSGQYGAVPIPAGADEQARMYDALTPLFDEVTDQTLLQTFKSAGFGVGPDGPGTREKGLPRRGVTITRDRFNVPHVEAKTYDAGIWAAGWIAAEDRGLLLQFARYNARVAAIDVPGVQALSLITQTKQFVPSAETENVLARQSAVLKRAGKKGRRVLHDIDTFVSGINAYLKKSGSEQKPWTRADVYALEALKGQFVGQGGGDEARRTQFFATLRDQLGSEDAAMEVFNDLRQHDDPEMPATIPATFPYEPVPVKRAGNVIIDAGSFRPVSAVADGSRYVAREKPQASNELMVDRTLSTTGRPLLVGGPQIGYFYPGLTYEIDMHAPGLVWRGATSAPLPGYMLIGRGPDFATTLTSAGADIIDQYAEELCDGSQTRYLYKGRCRDMAVFNAGTLDGKAVSFNQTVHGPVVGYATVDGKPFAISSKRSSRGRDALDLLLYRDLSTGKVKSPKTFFRAAAQSPQTFNSFYLDNRHIAVYTSGRLPVRPASVDPGLLTNGKGNFEWSRFVGFKGHPHQTDPKTHQIVNWNNNIARGFGAADDEWMRAGAVGRVDLLNRNLGRLRQGGKVSLPMLTAAMNAAATQDVRAIDTVPLLARLLEGGTPPSARAKQMLDLLLAWSDGGRGGSRLDVDLDGGIDDPGAAVIEVAWPEIADALMSSVLGGALDEFATLVPRHTLSQYSGWYQYFDKDIRTLLGDQVAGKLNRRYCGGGDLATCRSDVWNAIQAGYEAGRARYGSDDPAAWRESAAEDRIAFTPGAPSLTIRWTNRPSGIQQVISFKGHR